MGKINLCRGAVLLVFMVLLLPNTSSAQDPLELDVVADSTFQDEWGLAITPYAWFAAQSTDVGGQQLRSSFNDLASVTNFGFQARLYARWRWINFTADWTYADMKSESEILLTTIDFKINQHILDMKLGGKVYDTHTLAQEGGIGVWVAAGARYWDNTINYTVTTRPILPGNDPKVDTGREAQTWWDPVLGLSMHFPVTPKVGFFVRATAEAWESGTPPITCGMPSSRPSST